MFYFFLNGTEDFLGEHEERGSGAFIRSFKGAEKEGVLIISPSRTVSERTLTVGMDLPTGRFFRPDGTETSLDQFWSDLQMGAGLSWYTFPHLGECVRGCHCGGMPLPLVTETRPHSVRPKEYVTVKFSIMCGGCGAILTRDRVRDFSEEKFREVGRDLQKRVEGYMAHGH